MNVYCTVQYIWHIHYFLSTIQEKLYKVIVAIYWFSRSTNYLTINLYEAVKAFASAFTLLYTAAKAKCRPGKWMGPKRTLQRIWTLNTNSLVNMRSGVLASAILTRGESIIPGFYYLCACTAVHVVSLFLPYSPSLAFSFHVTASKKWKEKDKKEIETKHEIIAWTAVHCLRKCKKIKDL